eukprot:gi/632979237/ref/XP_007906359.1/ PREDICTED: TNFAIP3-interacting protein 1 isoform X2 [Callorhinchus milii]
MEGRTPFRIYDPGGVEAMTWNSLQQNNASYQQLLAENSVLKERMKGLQSLDLCQVPAQADPQTGGIHTPGKAEQKPPGSETSSEFEIVNMEEKMERSEGERELAGEDGDVSGYLNRLGSSLSVFAEETNRKQLLAHLSRMAVDFSRLTAKVQRNESKTSVLQTLCEQLRSENEDLRRKLDNDIQHQSRVVERIQQENEQLRRASGERALTGQRRLTAPTVGAEGQQSPEVPEQAGGGKSWRSWRRKPKPWNSRGGSCWR